MREPESGMAFVLDLLGKLADELNEPGIRQLDFETTSEDFDEGRISIVDRKKVRVVTKIGENDLSDAQSSSTIRRKLEIQIKSAVRSYYHKDES